MVVHGFVGRLESCSGVPLWRYEFLKRSWYWCHGWYLLWRAYWRLDRVVCFSPRMLLLAYAIVLLGLCWSVVFADGSHVLPAVVLVCCEAVDSVVH